MNDIEDDGVLDALLAESAQLRDGTLEILGRLIAHDFVTVGNLECSDPATKTVLDFVPWNGPASEWIPTISQLAAGASDDQWMYLAWIDITDAGAGLGPDVA